jgi:cyclopropane-fatty-acyl-phospholipid synthase
MSVLSIEHSVVSHHMDHIVYGAVVLGLAGGLVFGAPSHMAWVLVLLTLVGGGVWSVMEYLLHRFVLHGLQPFQSWHCEHHKRPSALIGTPVLVSVPLFGFLVALPAIWATGVWHGMALTLGVLGGYLVYSMVHHALHHHKLKHVWWQRRMLGHARHHHSKVPCCYGVTSGLWDNLLRTRGPASRG